MLKIFLGLGWVFFLFFFFQVLQRRYPNLALVTDHLLDIYINLTGDKYQASENSVSGSREIPEDSSESRSENKKPNLEGRELSLRWSYVIIRRKIQSTRSRNRRVYLSYFS